MQYITIVRGRLKDADQTAAMTAHNAIVDKLRPQSEPMGAAGHQAYVEPQDPGSFVAIDRWSNIDGLQKFLGDPNVQLVQALAVQGARSDDVHRHVCRAARQAAPERGNHLRVRHNIVRENLWSRNTLERRGGVNVPRQPNGPEYFDLRLPRHVDTAEPQRLSHFL